MKNGDDLSKSPFIYEMVSIRTLFNILWRKKWFIIVMTFLFGVASIIYALSLPNIYRAEVIIAPVSQDDSLRVSGQLGGLAALAGVNLGAGSGVDDTSLALEILKSRHFITRFIQKYDLLPTLMASHNWEQIENKLIFDSDLYDIDSKSWVRETALGRASEPSMQEAYIVFMDQFHVNQDKVTGMIKLHIEHISPFVAQEWAKNLVQEINSELKQRDIAEAQRSISYLQEQIEETKVADIKSTLYSLIEEQTKTLMLANARKEYAFQTVDPAIVPERKSKPKRALIVFLALIFGAFSACLIVFIGTSLNSEQKQI